MNRKSFWFGYALAIGVVLWLLGRQRQEEVEKALQRLREARPEMKDLHVIERVQEKFSGADKQAPQEEKQPAVAKEESSKEYSAAPVEADDDVAADDLKEITGIGPAFERRLNEAGVMRFAQLAALSEDEIRERIGLKPFQGDVASWIEQARTLAGD